MSTTATLPKHYSDLIALKRQTGTLGSIMALVSWDQETYMPPAGAKARAEQSSTLAGIIHERRTSTKIGDLIAQCEQDPELNQEGSAEAANIREMRRDYDLATKLPNDLVESLAKAQLGIPATTRVGFPVERQNERGILGNPQGFPRNFNAFALKFLDLGGQGVVLVGVGE